MTWVTLLSSIIGASLLGYTNTLATDYFLSLAACYFGLGRSVLLFIV